MLKFFLPLLGLFVLSEGRAKLPDKVNAAFFVNWAQYRPSPYTFTPDDLTNVVEDLDIIYYGFAFFCPDSSMVQPYWVTELDYCEGKDAFDVIPIEPMDTTFYQEINALKKAGNFKFIVSIGGWTFPSNFYSGMVSSETSRATFISSVVSYVQEYDFDGVDIDWEYPGSAARDDPVEIDCQEFQNVTDDGGSTDDKANFVSLMKEMREAFDSKLGDDYMITYCGQAGLQNVEMGQDVKELAKYVDLINIMSYDYTVSDTSSMNFSMYTAPNEPLYAPASASNIIQWNVNDTVTGYINMGAPADQILVGIAYYGHTWMIPDLGSNSADWGKYGLKGEYDEADCCGPTVQTYGGQPGEYTLQCGLYGYYEIQNANCPYVFNNETQTYIAYCSSDGDDSYTKSGTWLNYQGPDSMRSIIGYANKMGLKGAFSFDLSLDSYSNGWTFELTKLIEQCLTESSC